MTDGPWLLINTEGNSGGCEGNEVEEGSLWRRMDCGAGMAGGVSDGGQTAFQSKYNVSRASQAPDHASHFPDEVPMQSVGKSVRRLPLNE